MESCLPLEEYSFIGSYDINAIKEALENIEEKYLEKPWMDKKMLKKLFLDINMTAREIADLFGVKDYNVAAFTKKYKLFKDRSRINYSRHTKEGIAKKRVEEFSLNPKREIAELREKDNSNLPIGYYYCPVCGNIFFVPFITDWVYKIYSKKQSANIPTCSWGCLQKAR